MKMKKNISPASSETDKLPPVLVSIRQKESGIKVPEGYFDTLGSRIIDRINEQNQNVYSWSAITILRKPLVWAPLSATAIVALILLFVSPADKNVEAPASDLWTEINMAYDGSYAEEVLLAESSSIDNEIEQMTNVSPEFISLYAADEPSVTEIQDFLEEQDPDIETITEY